MKLKYIVVYEQTANSYAAYLPDLPGCVCAAKTWGEIQQMARDAVAFHIEGILADGDPLPERAMTLEDAMAYHAEPLTGAELASLSPYGAAPPALSTTFATVEVDVKLPVGAGGRIMDLP